MNDGTPLGVRVQEAFMAAVLIGPTTKTKQTKQGGAELRLACWLV
jgi:hypothetical protein